MIVCLCFKFHEIYIIYIFTRIIPYPSTSISLFLPYFGPSFREPRTSCQLPLRRVDARAPCRNGKRTTTHLQLLWKLVDFGLSSQAWWCRVSYVSLSFFYFNIVCVCVFFALLESTYFFETMKWFQWFHVRLFERKKRYVERTLIWKQIILRLLIIPWISRTLIYIFAANPYKPFFGHRYWVGVDPNDTIFRLFWMVLNCIYKFIIDSY